MLIDASENDDGMDKCVILPILKENFKPSCFNTIHYCDVIMDAIASQINGLTIVYSTVYSDADQRKHQSSTQLAFVRGNHRGSVNSPHKWPVTRKMFPFDDVIMYLHWLPVGWHQMPANRHYPQADLGAWTKPRSTHGSSWWTDTKTMNLEFVSITDIWTWTHILYEI